MKVDFMELLEINSLILPKQSFIRTRQLRSTIFTSEMAALNAKHFESAPHAHSFFFDFLVFALHYTFSILSFIKVFKTIQVVKIN
jgi:hypothetical protein